MLQSRATALSNPDNNNHSADENLRLGNLWDGIEQTATIMLSEVDPDDHRAGALPSPGGRAAR